MALKSTTASQLESRLTQASSRLSELEQTNNESSSSSNKNSNASSELYRRAKNVQGQLERLEITHSLLPLLQSLYETVDGDDLDGTGLIEQITLATRTCTHIASLLHLHNQAIATTSLSKWNAIQDWYTSLHDATRQSALSIFRKWMKQSCFPEEGGCATFKRMVTDQYDADTKENEEGVMNELQIQEWREISRCLIELQIVHDAFLSLQQHQGVTLPTQWRFDIIDEICRPIADRLRYHFLEETAILKNEESNNHNDSSKSMERLPEWLLRYLTETSEKIVDAVGGLQSFIENVVGSIASRDNLHRENDEIDDSITFNHVLQSLMSLHIHPSTYCLREIVRMARHALRSKSYFNHPEVVGRDAGTGIARRAIDQLFLFDSFVQDKLIDGLGSEVPKLVDVFLVSNTGLFQWWIDEELNGALVTLRSCANATLHSFRKAKDDTSTEKVDKSTENIVLQPLLLPSIGELFVSLIHSLRSKFNFFSNRRSQQSVISNVIGPISSEYLDMVHAESTLLRKQLLSRSKSNGIPSDNELTMNMMGWIGIVNGSHIASAMIRSCNRENNNVMERIAVSLEQMRDAIVEDLASAFIETLIMERAKFASYTMRCPFLLSQTTLDGHHRGQRESSLSSNLHLSIDLNDSYHVLSMAVQACQASLSIVEDMSDLQHKPNRNGLGFSSIPMLSYGVHAIEEALSISISQKLLDIAIDPQGMTPEIQLAGSQQFQCDATNIVNLFSMSRDVNNETGPLERVIAASNLMSISQTKLVHLRETLFDLSLSHDRPLFTGGNNIGGEVTVRRLEVESFYRDERLVMEAESMLGAMGFHALALEEALSIINRRV